ncbi:hypothetical protein M5K25_027467 [Dendrobium thyrsiflorum]|uniref:Uncharacterized protein n=1 Tax=Dendrobium thyrsiflorum TaxID=117978 RepID=A0ABD0TTX7_DENTH
MLNALLLPCNGDGAAPATLCSRYVRTYKYLLERDAGGPILPNIFSGFHGAAGIARGAVAAARILTGQMNPVAGAGLANTSLAFFGGRLYALGESDLPYSVRMSPEDGDIMTLGRCDFEGKLSMGMTAHPKKDPATGEIFAFQIWAGAALPDLLPLRRGGEVQDGGGSAHLLAGTAFPGARFRHHGAIRHIPRHPDRDEADGYGGAGWRIACWVGSGKGSPAWNSAKVCPVGC